MAALKPKKGISKINSEKKKHLATESNHGQNKKNIRNKHISWSTSIRYMGISKLLKMSRHPTRQRLIGVTWTAFVQRTSKSSSRCPFRRGKRRKVIHISTSSSPVPTRNNSFNLFYLFFSKIKKKKKKSLLTLFWPFSFLINSHALHYLMQRRG